MRLNIKSAIGFPFGYINSLTHQHVFLMESYNDSLSWGVLMFPDNIEQYVTHKEHPIFRHLLLPIRFAQVLKYFQEARCFCCVILEDPCCTLA